MRVVFVTGNDFKYEMAENRLSEHDILLERAELEIDEIQSDSLEEIGLDKARKAYRELERPVIVMDAGLFIQKYDGFPGPYTSYVDDTLGLEGLMELVDEPLDARIKQAVFYKDEENEKVFKSGQDGKLLPEKRGENGYFFDYIFESDESRYQKLEEDREEFETLE